MKAIDCPRVVVDWLHCKLVTCRKLKTAAAVVPEYLRIGLPFYCWHYYWHF